MAYTPTSWENEITPLNATNLNHIEMGIKNLDDDITVDSSVLSAFASDGWVPEEE